MSLHILVLTLEVFFQKDIILDEDDITLEIPLGIYDMTEKNVEYMSLDKRDSGFYLENLRRELNWE